MKNRFHVAVPAAFVMVMISTAAFGYALLSPTRRWFNADTPRQVNVDNRGVSTVTGGDPDHGVTAAVNAIKTWNSSGVNVTASSSSSVAYRQGDGISDVIFGDPLHICSGTCLAATLTGYYSTSSTGTCGGVTMDKITDADVAFNLTYDYTTPAQGSCSNEIYLDSVVAHEVGHVIGLAHSSSSSALMYASVAYCNDKQVASDDINGRNALYNCTLVEGGGGGCSSAGASCSVNSDCCSNSCKGGKGGKTCK
ncbi:MAG: matrixin family metalloprotease [Acidobacteria bacterium]|nr:matrixin family metalloprotease [Acidobacteriota bacterium]